MTIVEIEIATRVLEHQIERLEAKLYFLIRSYDDLREASLYQNQKKIATVKQEIDDMTEQRRALDRLRQMSIIRYSSS